MPALDRRLYIVTEAEGMRDDGGRFVPGINTLWDVWGTLLDDVSVPSIDGEGHRIGNLLSWRIRYNGRVRETPTSRVTVFPFPEAIGYQVIGIREASAGPRRRDTIAAVRDRRRFLDIEAEFSQAVSTRFSTLEFVNAGGDPIPVGARYFLPPFTRAADNEESN